MTKRPRELTREELISELRRTGMTNPEMYLEQIERALDHSRPPLSREELIDELQRTGMTSAEMYVKQIEEGLELLALPDLLPKPPGGRKRGPKPGEGRYAEADRKLFPQLERMIRRSNGVMSLTAAALALVEKGKVLGGGKAESRAKRLCKAYRETKKTR